MWERPQRGEGGVNEGKAERPSEHSTDWESGGERGNPADSSPSDSPLATACSPLADDWPGSSLHHGLVWSSADQSTLFPGLSIYNPSLSMATQAWDGSG